MATQKVICDTDVMIDYFDQANSRHQNSKLILEEYIGLDNIVLSAITKMEMGVGATDKSDLIRIGKKLNRFNIGLIDNEITLTAIEVIQKYSLSHRLTIPDSLIAATAIINGLELFTYNIKDYKFISGLALYKHK